MDKNISTYASPLPDPNNEEDGSQSITSNIRQLMEGKIDLSLKDNSNHPSHAILSSLMVDPGTNVDSKDGVNLVGMTLTEN